MTTIDTSTGRAFGDHGKGHDAIEYALFHIADDGEKIDFLNEWMVGGAQDEWPEFYKWLKKEGR
jgi:hypothetical protein